MMMPCPVCNSQRVVQDPSHADKFLVCPRCGGLGSVLSNEEALDKANQGWATNTNLRIRYDSHLYVPYCIDGGDGTILAEGQNWEECFAVASFQTGK